MGGSRETKLDAWWFVRVTLATVDLQTVNAVLVYGLGYR
jgi:hypothetical protein